MVIALLAVSFKFDLPPDGCPENMVSLSQVVLHYVSLKAIPVKLFHCNYLQRQPLPRNSQNTNKKLMELVSTAFISFFDS